MARDERSGGVGASAPAGRRSPPRHAALTLAKQDGDLLRMEESSMSGSLEKGFPLLIPRTVPVSAGWVAGDIRLVLSECLVPGTVFGELSLACGCWFV